MTAFFAAYRNETSKLVLRKKYIAFLIFGAVICVVWAAVGAFASGFVGMVGGVAINLTPTPMGVLPLFLQIIVPLLIFMSVTDLITSECSDHTMKAMLSRPVERYKLYFAKLSAVITYAAIYLAGVFVISTAFNQVLGRGLSVGEIFAAFASYALTLPPLAVLVGFAALASLFGRSSTLTMLLLVVVYFALNVLPIPFPGISELLFTSYLGWYRLWVGVLPSASRLLHMIAIVGGYGVVFFVAGSLIFDRKEY
ncbi:MAG: ABC transporter permease [Defluviitaleaceae bacterium]|nr:ABC transporter permease [Defluviitaleaceae bacterium]